MISAPQEALNEDEVNLILQENVRILKTLQDMAQGIETWAVGFGGRKKERFAIIESSNQNNISNLYKNLIVQFVNIFNSGSE